MRAIDLAIQAGRKRQSPRTGFVHYYPNFEGPCDTIPVYENFCFAFALFRLKTTEGVTEGKEIIERLLAFQTEDGNFPVYLHDYPKCWDFRAGLKIVPILTHILRDFGTVLNSAYKEKLIAALNVIPKNTKLVNEPRTAQDWFDHIVSQEKGGSYPIPYNRLLQLFLGENEIQERGEPQALPIEYVLAEKDGLRGRLLHDHIHQLYSALLYPFSSSIEVNEPYIWQKNRLLWKGESVHSLYGVHVGETLFQLPAGVEIGRDDLFEVLTYCDISHETKLTINGQKGMVFSLGDQVEIHTPSMTVKLCFELVEGTGDFCGHISRANRPGQIANQGAHQYAAYDWQIGIRTLRRAGNCIIKCTTT